MYIEKEICVVVDAFSTAKKIPKYLNGLGYQCIHIQSGNLPKEFQFDEKDFIKTIFYNGDIKSLLVELSSYTVKMCMAGIESGIALADQLSAALKLPSNGTALSEARRNKYLMVEEIAKQGLKTVEHFRSTTVRDIVSWVKNKFPVVLKPLDSANGHLVFFCETEEQLEKASQKIRNASNFVGEKNNEILVESFNGGQEYIVNTVSAEGYHYHVEVWRVVKLPNTTVYDFVEIVSPLEKEYECIVNYTSEVLSSLGILFGPSITELKYEEKIGPVLIETSPRLMNGAPLSITRKLFGFNQVTLSVEAYLDVSSFRAKLNAKPRIPNYYAMAVMLIAPCNGVMSEEVDLFYIEKLESFHGMVFNLKTGASFSKTVDSLTSPGEIYLISDSKDQLREDYQAIRSFEKNHLFAVSIECQV